jgi:uncharacterized damage-inducible protein DinB
MTSELLVALFDYGVWANARLLDQAAGLSDADLHRAPPKGMESIHQSFVHLVSADHRWFARWRQTPLPPMMTADQLPGLQAIRARWDEVIGPRRAYLAALGTADLVEAIQFPGQGGTTRSMPRWQGIVQCANHGTQHRAEIAAMLSERGRSPGDLDFSLYCLQA